MYGSAGGQLQVGRKKLTSSQSGILVGAPFVISVVVLLLFVTVYHRDLRFVVSFIIASGSIAAAAAFHFQDVPFRMYVSIFCLLSVCLSALIGWVSMDMAFSHFWFLYDSNAYPNIIPSESAAGYGDAGKVSFADGAQLDLSKALGYKDGSTYCVVPIVDDLQTPVVQFWAVGVNCCPPHGGFDCDDAWSSEARSGVVVHDAGGEYAAAIRQAEAAYELGSAEEYLLVRWVVDPEMVELNFWRVGIAVLLAGLLAEQVLFALGAFCLSLMLQGYTSFLR